MANLPPDFDTQFIDAGEPAAGYKLYTYETGTTTPKTTYSDQAGAIPNSNPITLDAEGRCSLWLGAGEYTFALYDRAIGDGGSLIKTWNDVSASASADSIGALVTRLASTTDEDEGAGMAGFSPSLNYAAGTLGAHANADSICVWDLMTALQLADIRSGAGVVDQSTAFLAAHTLALATKRCVYAPSGLYRLESELDFHPSVGLHGEEKAWWANAGPGYAYISGTWLYKAHNNNCISVIGSADNTPGSTIKHITIRSDSTAFPSGHGIFIDKVAEGRVQHVNVQFVGGNAFHIGDSLGDVTTHIYLDDCYSNNAAGRSFYVRAKWTRGRNIRSDGGTWGLWLENAPESKFSNPHFEGFTQGAVSADQSANCSIRDHYIGNSATAPEGIRLTTNSDYFKIKDGNMVGAGAAGSGVSVGNCAGVSVTDNSISGWAFGVNDGGTDTTVKDNTFSTCGAPIVLNGNRPSYADNRITGTTGSNAILVATAGSLVGTITGNDVDKRIWSGATSSGTDFSGIRVIGNPGHKTDAAGQTGVIASATTVPHGLAGAPEGVNFTSTTTGASDLRFNADATNITFLWAGPNQQISWQAWNKCAKQ